MSHKKPKPPHPAHMVYRVVVLILLVAGISASLKHELKDATLFAHVALYVLGDRVLGFLLGV